MENLVFRDSQQGDLDAIVDIYNSTIASRLVTADISPVTPASKQAWFDQHSADKRPLWIVENNATGELIGWVSFQSFYGRPAYDGTVEISIYLHENQRGKGYGKRILQQSINCAPRFGITTLLAYIFAHNMPSISLFNSFHFQEWAHLPDIAVLDGRKRSLKILGLQLPQ